MSTHKRKNLESIFEATEEEDEEATAETPMHTDMNVKNDKSYDNKEKTKHSRMPSHCFLGPHPPGTGMCHLVSSPHNTLGHFQSHPE